MPKGAAIDNLTNDRFGLDIAECLQHIDAALVLEGNWQGALVVMGFLSAQRARLVCILRSPRYPSVARAIQAGQSLT